jgi:leucyl aminopeptidase
MAYHQVEFEGERMNTEQLEMEILDASLTGRLGPILTGFYAAMFNAEDDQERLLEEVIAAARQVRANLTGMPLGSVA